MRAHQELWEERQVEADEDDDRGDAPQKVRVHPARHFRPPEMHRAQIAHEGPADHDEVEMGDDEVGVRDVHVDAERRDEEARQAADREEADEAEGVRIGFADDLDIDKAGRFVYFTDASSKWHYNEDLFDLIEHGGHGRLLRHDLHTGTTTVLMRDLQFANGVTLGPHDAYVLVTETGAYRVHRYWLKGERAGSHEVWLDNLPGFPDNIRFNGHDRFWLALPVPRDPMLDFLAPYPLLRFGLLQYARYRPLPMKRIAFVLGIDLQGRVVANLQHHGADAFHFITQVLEHEGWLYCSSLHEGTLARVSLAGLPVTASA